MGGFRRRRGGPPPSAAMPPKNHRGFHHGAHRVFQPLRHKGAESYPLEAAINLRPEPIRIRVRKTTPNIASIATTRLPRHQGRQGTAEYTEGTETTLGPKNFNFIQALEVPSCLRGLVVNYVPSVPSASSAVKAPSTLEVVAHMESGLLQRPGSGAEPLDLGNRFISNIASTATTKPPRHQGAKRNHGVHRDHRDKPVIKNFPSQSFFAPSCLCGGPNPTSKLALRTPCFVFSVGFVVA